MTVRKLSDSDKQEIIARYRSPGETTTTLAVEYGVSNSTISRILKTGLPEADYEALIQQKRGRSLGEVMALDAETTESLTELLDPNLAAEEEFEPELTQAQWQSESVNPIAEVDSAPEQVPLETLGSAMPVRRSRRRSSAPEPSEPVVIEQPIAPIELIDSLLTSREVSSVSEPAPETPYTAHATALEAILGEELPHPTDKLQPDDLEDDDLEDGDLEDDLEADDLEDDEPENDLEDDLDEAAINLKGPFLSSPIRGQATVQVLPLTDAPLPKTCYLVVDRAAELVARPLKEFGELGQISEAETLAKTLPVFDNHRVAKRFSNPRTQRVIKLPDGKVLQKTSSHLQAKGITHLLIDGQVYALQSNIDGAEDSLE
jgi:transposase-like protein